MASLLRTVKQTIDRFGIRPSAVAMVLGCTALAGTLSYSKKGELVATGVAHSPTTILSTETTATVRMLHVSLGQRVARGQTLVTLESLELKAELAEVEAQIRQVARTADLAQAELLAGLESSQQEEVLRLLEADRDARVAQVEAERERTETMAASQFLGEASELVKQGVMESEVVRERADAVARQKAEEDAANLLSRTQSEHARLLRQKVAVKLPERLLTATAELHQAELNVLERQRDGLAERIRALELHAPSDGVVAELLPVGSTATSGVTVVRVVPPFAESVVAFVPPDAAPPVLNEKVPYEVALADGRSCKGRAQAQAFGEVERKPEHLVGPMGSAAYGFPVRIALDEQCQLPIGQVVELRLSTP